MKDALHELANKIQRFKNDILNEEATKNSCILPFLSILGYDIHNPQEVVPEYIADLGIKNGEKVDFTIAIDNEASMLVEAKTIGTNLNKHYSQLFRYFTVVDGAKVGILTDGVEYQFYTDIKIPNKMDQEPFFVFNIFNFNDKDYKYLTKFKKENFNVNKIKKAAEKLYYEQEIDQVVSNLLANPNDEFVNLISSEFYDGVKTPKIRNNVKPMVVKAIEKYKNNFNTNPKVVESKITEQVQENPNVKTINIRLADIDRNEFNFITIHNVTYNGQSLKEEKNVTQYYLRLLEMLLADYELEVVAIMNQLQANSKNNFMLYNSDEKMLAPHRLANGYIVNTYENTFCKINRLSKIVKGLNDKVDIEITYSKISNKSI